MRKQRKIKKEPQKREVGRYEHTNQDLLGNKKYSEHYMLNEALEMTTKVNTMERISKIKNENNGKKNQKNKNRNKRRTTKTFAEHI